MERGKRMTGLRAWRQWAPVAPGRQRIVRSLRLSLLASSLLGAGCTTLMPFGQASAPSTPSSQQPGTVALGNPDRKVGILLPLSGPNGTLGSEMLRAARLALSAPGSPTLDVHDTAAPGGAVHAAQLATAGGDAIILGPLTSGDTAAVAPVAHAAGVPVLAFTSDVAQAQPGVWVMGITIEQQMRRLVFAAKAEGRSRIAALLPSNAVGNALADGLNHACADAGLPPPTILTHAGTADSIDATMKQLSDFSGRQAAQQATAQQAGSPQAADPSAQGVPGSTSGAPAAPLPAPGSPAVGPAGTAPGAPPPLPPPPFDALLLGDTGLQLQEAIVALHASGINRSQVRVMGPGLWGAFASKLGGLSGAWYADPDPSARLGFAAQYEGAYHQSPKLLAGIPFDAAALARSLAASGYQPDALLRPDGFSGVDGVFALQPDGHVQRALAIFQVEPGGGGRIVQPAPQAVDRTGS